MKVTLAWTCLFVLIGGVAWFMVPKSAVEQPPVARAESALEPEDAQPAVAPQAPVKKKSSVAFPPPLQTEPLPNPLVDPQIIVLKSRRRLQLYSSGNLLRTYPVGLGFSPVKDKIKEGDGATPEGEFYVFTKNPKSKYYVSLGVSYPNAEDAERGLRDGLISKGDRDKIVEIIRKQGAPPQKTPLGGDIFIHGRGAKRDWTWGCVALEDEQMRELFDAVPVGTPVVIKP